MQYIVNFPQIILPTEEHYSDEIREILNIL